MNIDSSLVNELRQKDYRDAYVASQITIGIPFQIRALRNHRRWSQEEFANRSGMSQPRVSEMERPGERRLTIETLLRLAAAFDVGLQIRFVSFSQLVEWSENFSPDTFAVPSFEDELAEQKEKRHAEEAASIAVANSPETHQWHWLQMQTQGLAHQQKPDKYFSASHAAKDLSDPFCKEQLGSIMKPKYYPNGLRGMSGYGALERH